jgi:hypothetical protein
LPADVIGAVIFFGVKVSARPGCLMPVRAVRPRRGEIIRAGFDVIEHGVDAERAVAPIQLALAKEKFPAELPRKARGSKARQRIRRRSPPMHRAYVRVTIH